MPLGGALTGMAIAAAAGGAGSLIGGLVGQSKASGDFANADAAAQKAAQQLINTGMPPDLAKQVIMQKYKAAGQLTPTMEQALSLGPSQAAGVQTDQNSLNAQLQALQQFQQVSQTGNTAQDQLANRNMVNSVNQANQGRQQAILQNAQATGMGGSGASLAAQLANAQGSANNASQQGLQIAANSNQARMAALGQAAGLGGQINSQQFGQAQTKANAADQFQRFNVANQQAVANQNVQASNQAQAANLANAQQISNANTGMANSEAQRMNNAKLTDWQSQNQRNQIINQGYNQSAGNYNQQGNQVANQSTQMGAGIGGLVGSVANLSGAFNPGTPTPITNSGLTSPTLGSSIGSGNSNFGGNDGTGMMGNGNYSFASGGVIHDPSEMCYDSGGFVRRFGYGGQVESQNFDNGGQVQQQPQMQQQMMPQQQAPQPQRPGFVPPFQPQQQMQQMQGRSLPSTGVLNAQAGALVPGQAMVHGDNLNNDIQPIMASPDEAVIPRSIMLKPDAPERAKEFVKGLLASKAHRR